MCQESKTTNPISHKPKDPMVTIKGWKPIGFPKKCNRGQSLEDTRQDNFIWEEMANGVQNVAKVALGKSKGFGPKSKQFW